MASKPVDPTEALVAVVKALEALTPTDRDWVLRSAASRWALLIPDVPIPHNSLHNPPASASKGGVGNAPDVAASLQKKDVRAFIRAKRPTSDVQRVACLGYFLVQTSGSPGFLSKDIAKAHIESGGSKINLPRALDNATRQSKYLSNRGPKEKQLTTLGEDIVEALPDQSAVVELQKQAKVKKKPGSRARKKTKK